MEKGGGWGVGGGEGVTCLEIRGAPQLDVALTRRLLGMEASSWSGHGSCGPLTCITQPGIQRGVHSMLCTCKTYTISPHNCYLQSHQVAESIRKQPCLLR